MYAYQGDYSAVRAFQTSLQDPELSLVPVLADGLGHSDLFPLKCL